MNNKIKDGIEKSSIPFGIKIKLLYNKISKEMRFILKLFREYNDDIFVDGTFFIAPKFKLDSFYTTSFAILKNKEQETYKILFEKLKKNANTSINKATEISVLIERYKNSETKLIDAKCDRNNTINLWFYCLTDLNNII
ncbi:hypothetical protein U3516DRAFT_733904 [Neocallimastix sp. 'constans']